jgi:hypothetical protein
VPNSWLTVPLDDYEAHMKSSDVQQLTPLADLFKYSLDHCFPESVAVLGVAGGNGLEHIDTAVTKRIVGIDINQQYLDTVQQRFGTLPGLELYGCDLAQTDFCVIAPVALVHAALIFEHVGLGRPLTNALSLVAPGGMVSVVLQLPSEGEPGIACTGYASMQALKRDFALIAEGEFQRLMTQQGFRLAEQHRRAVPAGKALWLGIFSSPSVQRSARS